MNNSEHILEFVAYEPGTGAFVWTQSPGGGVLAGAAAGHIDERQHVIRFRGKLYLGHRVAWRIKTGEWPTHEVDHKDTNPLNNAWTNLRAADRASNMANTHVRRDSQSQLKGAGWSEHARKWKSKIKLNGRQVHLGYFDTAGEAHKAYCDAAKKRSGEFMRAA